MEDGFSPIFQHRDAAIAAVVDRAFLAAVVDLAFLAAVVDLVCSAVGYACPSAADDRWHKDVSHTVGLRCAANLAKKNLST